MEPLASGVAAAWPLLVAIAGAIAVDRHRWSRRRETLNRSLHELRRPLHFLTVAWSAPSVPAHRGAATRGHLTAALAALAELDAEINGRRRASCRGEIGIDDLVSDAIERWRAPAAALGRQIELRLRARAAVVVGEREALSRAIDNLVANALDHGRGRVRVEVSEWQRRLRIAVIDCEQEARAGIEPTACRGSARDGGPQRGHGLDLVVAIASRHGGRFAFSRERSRTCAVLELPLARESARPQLPALNRKVA